jgi:glycosyltransferase involved in cell wall biosynthesis
MQRLRGRLGEPATWIPGARIIYDAEAIAAEREVVRRRLGGEQLSDASAQRLVNEEIDLARGVDAVLTVSPAEGVRFTARGIGNVQVVSHLLIPEPTPKPFDAREGLLFVGAFNVLSPNADAVLWFIDEVLPLLRERLGFDVPLLVAGHNPPTELTRVRASGVRILGSVDDLTPLYDSARVFVAPTRYAAGIPFKVGHAAAHGLPVVATTLLANQLAWSNDRQLLAADTPDAFAAACASLYSDRERWERIRASALMQIADEYSSARFRAGIETALAYEPAAAQLTPA